MYEYNFCSRNKKYRFAFAFSPIVFSLSQVKKLKYFNFNLFPPSTYDFALWRFFYAFRFSMNTLFAKFFCAFRHTHHFFLVCFHFEPTLTTLRLFISFHPYIYPPDLQENHESVMHRGLPDPTCFQRCQHTSVRLKLFILVFQFCKDMTEISDCLPRPPSRRNPVKCLSQGYNKIA